MDRITGRQDNHETFERVLERRVARRKFIMSSMGALPVLAAAGLLLKPSAAKAAPVDGLNFSPISLMTNDQVTVPAGYSSQVLISWGGSCPAGRACIQQRNHHARDSAAAVRI